MYRWANFRASATPCTAGTACPGQQWTGIKRHPHASYTTRAPLQRCSNIRLRAPRRVDGVVVRLIDAEEGVVDDGRKGTNGNAFLNVRYRVARIGHLRDGHRGADQKPVRS